MKLRWTEKAAADSLAIHSYIAERSEAYADAVYERTLERPRQLMDHPRSGSIVPEFERDDIRELFIHSFRLIYLVLPDEVQILTVIHGSRLLTMPAPDTV